MTETATAEGSAAAPTRRPLDLGMTVAALASLGAGAIHAVAMGVHSEPTQALIAFTAAAVFQLGWGLIALTYGGRKVAVIGAIGHLLLLGGFLLAKAKGLSFVDGLEESAAVELGDGMAAALAAVASVAAMSVVVGARQVNRSVKTWATPALAMVALVLTLPAMVAAARPSHHAGGEAAAGHHAETGQVAGDTADHHGDAGTKVAKPYDPAEPIDLSGTEGVTPEQQARAENLIANTLEDLPAFADTADAEAAGFNSIGDAATGYEHYINWSYVTDDAQLDADRPEALVYQELDGKKKLVAAMFMAYPGTTLDDVPEIGGPLTQWHIHDDLCFTGGDDSRVVGLVDGDGKCAPPTVKLDPAPMIHVWTIPHECGPFASLEGIPGGQIKEGEERLCDTAHGGH